MNKKRDKVDSSGAAIVCGHVAKQGYPILIAEKDRPTMPEDSGWQFLCNSGERESEDEAQVWALSEVLEIEPGLGKFVDAAPRTTFIRKTKDSPWVKQRKS